MATGLEVAGPACLEIFLVVAFDYFVWTGAVVLAVEIDDLADQGLGVGSPKYCLAQFSRVHGRKQPGFAAL